MVIVKISYYQENISSICISGHALFSQSGKDIVCAGISSIVFGGFNSLEKNFAKQVELEIDLNKAFMRVKEMSSQLLIALNVIIDQLQTIAISYPRNIKIKRSPNEL